MKRIGVPNLSYLPQNNRIKNLYIEFSLLLSSEFEIIVMPLFDENMTESERDTLTRKFIDGIDIFFGYDRQFMRVRYRYHTKPKVILPLFADMTRGGITLWLNKHYFIKSDIILFSSLADQAIYQTTLVESELHTIVAPLPLASCFEDTQRISKTRTDKEPVNILYVGRLVREKNILEIIRSCAHLNNTNFTLTLVGDWSDYIDGGQYRSEVMALIDDYDMSNRIVFTGFLQGTKLVDAYRKADLFISLSTNPDENFGLVIVEALSQGLPILCSDWGGFKDHVIDGWNGYKIRTELLNGKVHLDITETSKCLEKMCLPESLGVMSDNSKVLYKTKYQRSIVFGMLKSAMSYTANNEKAILKFSEKAVRYCMKYILCHLSQKRECDTYFGQDHYATCTTED